MSRPPDDRAAGASVARLRDLRNRRAPDLSLGFLEGAAKRYERDRKRLAHIVPAWEAACPPDLLGRTRIVSLSRGVLTIAVRGASTRYALDRALRNGAEQRLREASRSTIRRVKITDDGASS